MLKKTVLLTSALTFFATLAIAGLAMANNGPETMELTSSDASKKPAVVFPHKKHQDMMECSQCHHSKDADGKQAPLAEGQAPAKCETCHNADMANKKMNSFKKAAHKNCKDCHKAGFNGKKGPKKCGECHIKK